MVLAPGLEALRFNLDPPHARDRIVFPPAPIWLEPTKAVMVAMILHELATNAAKYGALSNGTGDVKWERHSNPDLVKLVWQKSGGPSVSSPKGRGFGSHLIERAFGGQLGRAQLVFSPPGLFCTHLKSRSSDVCVWHMCDMVERPLLCPMFTRKRTSNDNPCGGLWKPLRVSTVRELFVNEAL